LIEDRTLTEPEEVSSPGRHHPGTVGGIIPEWWAASNRNRGRHHLGMVGGIDRNQHIRPSAGLTRAAGAQCGL